MWERVGGGKPVPGVCPEKEASSPGDGEGPAVVWKLLGSQVAQQPGVMGAHVGGAHSAGSHIAAMWRVL